MFYSLHADSAGFFGFVRLGAKPFSRQNARIKFPLQKIKRASIFLEIIDPLCNLI
jgi:hypothetical protein